MSPEIRIVDRGSWEPGPNARYNPDDEDWEPLYCAELPDGQVVFSSRVRRDVEEWLMQHNYVVVGDDVYRQEVRGERTKEIDGC